MRKPWVRPGLYVGTRTRGGRWGENGLRHRRSPRGRRTLHIKKERGGAATRRHLTFTLLSHFPRLFTVLAADGEGKRTETLFRDFFSTLEAVAVVALFQADQRVVDLVQRFRLHLDEGELDIVLDVGL